MLPEDLHFVLEPVKRLPGAHAPYWTTAEIIAALDREPDLLELRKDRSKP